MRGTAGDQPGMFSYVTMEARIPADHPLRAMREMTDAALRGMSRQLGALYSHTGRPSIPPEHLLRALVVQVLFSVRSERLLMEQLEYNLLFRWFVGLQMDDQVWDVTVFTKNRDRLLEGNVAAAFFDQVIRQAREAGLLSDEHFTVDGTLLEACAGHKSFRPKTARAAVVGAGASGTSAASGARTTRTLRRRIPTRGCTRRDRARRRSSASWVTRWPTTAMGLWSARPRRWRPGRRSGKRRRRCCGERAGESAQPSAVTRATTRASSWRRCAAAG